MAERVSGTENVYIFSRTAQSTGFDQAYQLSTATSGTGGPGGGSGSIEPRLAALEANVSHVVGDIGLLRNSIGDQKSSIDKLLWAGIAGVCALVTAGWQGYEKLRDRSEAVGAQITQLQFAIERQARGEPNGQTPLIPQQPSSAPSQGVAAPPTQ